VRTAWNEEAAIRLALRELFGVDEYTMNDREEKNPVQDTTVYFHNLFFSRCGGEIAQ
jgi:hypothetical protein